MCFYLLLLLIIRLHNYDIYNVLDIYFMLRFRHIRIHITCIKKNVLHSIGFAASKQNHLKKLLTTTNLR